MSERQDQISDYLLGELDATARADFERAMSADASLAAEVRELTDLVTTLDSLPDEAWLPETPPPFSLAAARNLDTNDEARPGTDRTTQPKKQGRLHKWFADSFAVKPAVAFAAVALFFVAGVGVGTLTGGSDDSASPLTATIQQAQLAPVDADDAAATGVADVKKGGSVIRLKVSGLNPTDDDKFYEAWLMDEKNGLVAIGTFRVEENGEATLDLPVPVGTDAFPIVDISLQEVNGKPDHSGVSVLRGTLN